MAGRQPARMAGLSVVIDSTLEDAKGQQAAH